MKNNFYLVTGFILLLAACGQKSEKNSKDKFDYPATDPLLTNVASDSLQKKKELSSSEQCFMAHVKKDSAFLRIRKTDNQVSGTLSYQFAEKDNSKGTFTGTIRNDTLLLNYKYEAEGRISERPLEMVYENGNLYEIYDHQKPDKGSFIFTPSTCR